MEEKTKILSKEAFAVIVMATATLALILTLLLFGKDKGIEPKSKTYYQYFDTVSTIYDYADDSDKSFEENCRIIEERLSYYHKLFDIYNEYEGMANLATVNRLAGAEEVKIDRELVDFLLYSVSMYELTGGNVNIAMGSVLSIWHNYREEGKSVPKLAELEAAGEHTDIKNLVIDEEASTVKFLDPQMSLDVGAIAKGYAAEKCAAILKSRGADSYVLDLGGNLRAIGEKPNGEKWRTGIKNPNIYSNEPYVYYLNISDTSVVTSGNYQRFYIVDGKSYHHIIDKDTLFPSENFASVTVITENSGLADALSTALFNMTMDEAVALLDTLDGVSAVWIMPNGEVKTYGLE